MDSNELIAIVRRFDDAPNAGDVDTMSSLHADNIIVGALIPPAPAWFQSDFVS